MIAVFMILPAADVLAAFRALTEQGIKTTVLSDAGGTLVFNHETTPSTTALNPAKCVYAYCTPAANAAMANTAIVTGLNKPTRRKTATRQRIAER